MSTFRVTFEATNKRGPRPTASYTIQFCMTAQQAVVEARKTAAIECPGYRLKGVEEVSAALEHATPGPFMISRKKARPAKRAAKAVA